MGTLTSILFQLLVAPSRESAFIYDEVLRSSIAECMGKIYVVNGYHRKFSGCRSLFPVGSFPSWIASVPISLPIVSLYIWK